MGRNNSPKMVGSALFLLVAFSLTFFQPGPATAQGPDKDLQQRVERLERVIQEQRRMLDNYEKEMSELKSDLKKQSQTIDEKVQAASRKPEHLEMLREIISDIRLTETPQTPADQEVKTIYDEGFYLKGKDDQLRISGWLQGDARWFLDSDNHDNDTFLIRRARFDVRGVLEDDWLYRIYATFIGERNGVLQEGWLEYRKYPSFRIRAGQVFEPFSLEAIYSALWIDFLERAVIVNTLSPQEDIGIMIFGKLWNNQIEYALGAFNGQGRNREAVVDDKDFTGRLVFTPFLHSSALSALKKLSFGGSFSTGNNKQDLSGFDLRTEATTTFLDVQSGVNQDGRLTRWGLELDYGIGPFGLKTEYLQGRFDNITKGTVQTNWDLRGAYFTAGYVLTGEDWPQSTSVKPKQNFDPAKGGWGAFQLLGRYQFIETNDDLLNKGFAVGTDKARTLTLGLNWYWNRHVRFQLNYSYSWFDDTITVGGAKLDKENVIISRFQYVF
jgi:phosphate-selective porin OprO/OprP